MTEPIDLRPDHLKIVHDILSESLPEGVSVRVFGSRATWSAKTHSDLDLALKGEGRISKSVVAELEEAFSESDLPFKVDVVDWHAVAPKFQAVIDRDGISLSSDGREGARASSSLPDWASRRFGDLLAEPVRNGVYKKKEFHGRGAKMVNMGELFAHPRLFDIPMKRVELDHKELDRFTLRANDLIFARRSLTAEGAGKCSIVYEVGEPTAFESSIIRARPDQSIASSMFLYYYFSSPAGQHSLDTIRRQVAVAGITGSDLSNLEIRIPDVGVQRQIASILSALDDKIELNRQMAKTLEAQARAVFRDWFVDFGPVKARMADSAPYLAPDLWSLFPDGLGDDGVPEGWKAFRVDEVAHHHTRTLTPMSAPSELFEHFSLPAFDSGQQPVLEPGGGIKSNKTIVPEGAILLSKLNPEIPRVWWPKARGEHLQIASTEFLTFTPIEGFPRCLLYSLFSDDVFRRRLEGMVTGTSKSHQRVNPTALKAVEALVGDKRLFSAFDELCAPLMDKVLSSRAQVATLAQTRDLLIPKLMSGEAKLGAAEKELAKAL